MIASRVLKFSIDTGVRELRFHLSQTGEASTALKDYLVKTYPTLKKSNPNLPILIRESYGVPPTLYARFALGKESKYSLDGLDKAAIDKLLKGLK